MELSSIYRYPLKSAIAESLDRVETDALGVVGDRRWMLVDPSSGRFLSQRVAARMALLSAELTADGGLRLAMPGLGSIEVARPEAGDLRPVLIWGRAPLVPDAGDLVASWLSQAIERPCRLVHLPAGQGIQVDEDYAALGQQTAFTDGFPFLLIGQASLEDLESRVGRPLGMVRFRPSLVVQGAEPYAEDRWQRIRIGTLTFRLVKPCSRCVIPTLDPITGVRDAAGEPLKTLMTYRKGEGGVFFGQNLIAENCGELAVGMPVEVLG